MADTVAPGPASRALAQRALDTATARGASYADVRIIGRRWEEFIFSNGVLDAFEDGDDLGFGVRVLAGGAWGFAASPVVTEPEADRVAAQAVEIATSAGPLAWPVSLGPAQTHVFAGRGPCERDPFAVPFEDKVALLARCDEEMRAEPAVTVAQGTLDFLNETRFFASTEGSEIYQDLTDSGGGLKAIAVRRGEQQQRTYPQVFGWHSERGGWEAIEQMGLVANARRIGAEAAELLDAPPCPEGPATVILDAAQTAMQVHESLGHALELDRVLGMEAATAGTSFLTPDKLGSFRVGSDVVTVVADPGTPRAAGGFFFDDDGVPARRVPLIERGRVAEYLSARDSAAALGRTSSGASRAAGWNRLPLVRMTVVNLEPGTWPLPDLIADTDRGLLLETTASWSIDDRRLEFEFATETAREIRGGQAGRLYRGPAYRGNTPRFWRACDAVADADSWHLFSLRMCFKGQPGQLVRVTHGAAPARFRAVDIIPR